MPRPRNTVIRNRIVAVLSKQPGVSITRDQILQLLKSDGGDAIAKPSALPLASMVAEGTIVQEGSKRGTKYRLPTT